MQFPKSSLSLTIALQSLRKTLEIAWHRWKLGDWSVVLYYGFVPSRENRSLMCLFPIRWDSAGVKRRLEDVCKGCSDDAYHNAFVFVFFSPRDANYIQPVKTVYL